jgi:hypothetical protein
VPHASSDELHCRRAKGVILGELELGCEDAAFEWGAAWAFNQGFPVKHVIFGDGAGGDSLWWVCGEVLVFVEEALLSDVRRHFWVGLGASAKWRGVCGEFGGMKCDGVGME